VLSREDGRRGIAARFLPYPAAQAAVVAPEPVHDVRILDWNEVAHTMEDNDK